MSARMGGSGRKMEHGAVGTGQGSLAQASAWHEPRRRMIERSRHRRSVRRVGGRGVGVGARREKGGSGDRDDGKRARGEHTAPARAEQAIALAAARP